MKNPHLLSCLLACLAAAPISVADAEIRAGAAAVDITPEKLPVLVNGSMRSRSVSEITSRLHARALVLDDGRAKIAIVVVDSCMISRRLLDEAKQLAATRTGIDPANMMISATHAHSAPSAYGVLGTPTDPNYPPFLRLRLAAAIEAANKNLEPAEVGWGVGNAAPFTAVRRWIRRPDRVLADPFGNPTVRANMHPGYRSPDATGPSGPIDPSLSIIAVRSKKGRPLAVLANFSMHYYGAKGISADYYGLFAQRLSEKIVGIRDQAGSPFVGIMSHGCSGDIYNRDYLQPAPKKPPHDLSSYTDAIVRIAHTTYQSIDNYRGDIPIRMAQKEMELRYRTPDKQRLEWARKIVAGLQGLPQSQTEVYAREAIMLHERQKTKVLLQAIRIGDIGITGMPNEVYALTGLKLKALSPLKFTVTVDLANGAEGYIPPPEQHHLGGYNTWPARSAGLEIQAEPKMVEAVVQLLERIAGRPRKTLIAGQGPASKAIVAARPLAYWRFEEFQLPSAADAMNRQDGLFELGTAFYLRGPSSAKFHGGDGINRSVHFAGGRMRTRLAPLKGEYSVSLWLWNGLPNGARPLNGFVFSRGRDHASDGSGDHLGIGGTSGHAGRVIFSNGKKTLGGKTEIPRWTWTHVVLVRNKSQARVYVNGKAEFDAICEPRVHPNVKDCYIGGRCDNVANFEGRLDEVAVFSRALAAAEVKTIYQAAKPIDSSRD